ncbi:MAG: hypothetical protein RIS54_559 [Verrucomicrobiota bacterium]
MSVAKEPTHAVAWRVARITLVAVGLYVLFRVLPTGTNLSHMDFRVEGENVIQMCDPANPQFLPVVNVRSPVEFTVQPIAAPRAGQPVTAVLTLRTHAGKAVGPADLLNVHTELLHLMVADPQLMDYHHVHPRPGREPGQWTFAFTPRFGGEYRLFADFTPAATGLGLYASTKLNVAGDPPAPAAMAAAHAPAWATTVDGIDFSLRPAGDFIRAGQEAVMTLVMSRPDGGEVPLAPVMDAFAHVVAFDRDLTGFAHLHPQEIDLAVPPDRHRPTLTFRIVIPSAGRYVAWAQVNNAGTELYAPFWFDVVP